MASQDKGILILTELTNVKVKVLLVSKDRVLRTLSQLVPQQTRPFPTTQVQDGMLFVRATKLGQWRLKPQKDTLFSDPKYSKKKLKKKEEENCFEKTGELFFKKCGASAK